MGGYTALKLLQTHNIKNLVLLAPAVYSQDAFSVQFDQGFTDIIRQFKSWEKSDIFSSLQQFTGNLLVIIGTQDEVIPMDVIQLIDKHAINTTCKEIVLLENCSHQMHEWLNHHISDKKYICSKISNLINNSF